MGRENLLIGTAAIRLGVCESTLRRACNAGVIDVPRAGVVRLFPLTQLSHYREQLRQAGYLDDIGRPGPVRPRPVAAR